MILETTPLRVRVREKTWRPHQRVQMIPSLKGRIRKVGHDYLNLYHEFYGDGPGVLFRTMQFDHGWRLSH